MKKVSGMLGVILLIFLIAGTFFVFAGSVAGISVEVPAAGLSSVIGGGILMVFGILPFIIDEK